MTVGRALSRELVARTLVSLTQDISQGLSIKKIINVNCNIPGQQTVCLECIEFHKQEQELLNATIDMTDIRQACTYACDCTVSNVNMTSAVSCDFSSMLSGTITSDQVQSTLETVWQMMSIEDKLPVVDMDNASKVLQTTATKIIDICRSDTFQASVHDLKAKQYVLLRGVGTIHGVTIQEAIHVVEQIIETNQSASSMVDELNTGMITIVSHLVRVSSAKLIEWIVRIILYLVTFIIVGVVAWSTISLGKTAILVT
jgi:hypothetical protein